MAIQNIILNKTYAPVNAPSSTNTIKSSPVISGAINQYIYTKKYTTTTVPPAVVAAAQNKIYIISRPATQAIEDKLYSITSALRNQIYTTTSSTKNAIADQIYRISQNTKTALQDSLYKMVKNLTYTAPPKSNIPPSIGSSTLQDSTLTQGNQTSKTYYEETPVPTVQLPQAWNNTTLINDQVNEESINSQVVDPKYFTNVLSQVNRREQIQTFSYDYLSYLFFKSNINIVIDEFYSAVANKIETKDFWSEEEAQTQNDMDAYLIHYVFNQIWTEALRSNSAPVKNVIGFYIYFNQKLDFFNTLIRGMHINDFLNSMTLNGVINNLTELGLYPLNIGNLFNRLWYSFKYSANPDGNKAEIKMSLNEFYNYRVNRLSASTYSGLPKRIDKLLLTTDISLIPNKRKSFSSAAEAFYTLRDLDYNFKFNLTNENKVYEDPADEYLSRLIPIRKEKHTIGLTDQELETIKQRRPEVYKDTSIFLTSKELNRPNQRLWELLESFDNDYKISVSFINKSNIENLFFKFSQDVSFPLDSGIVDVNKDYTKFWIYWLEFLNAYANNLNPNDYDNLFDYIIELVNIRFIFKYLDSNNTIKDYIEEDYLEDPNTWNPLDGEGFIIAKLQTINSSLDTLKERTKALLRDIILKDKRFFLV